MAVGQGTHEGRGAQGREKVVPTENKPQGHAVFAILGSILITAALISAAVYAVRNSPELMAKLSPQGDLGGNNNNPGLVVPATKIPTQAPLRPTENLLVINPTFTPIPVNTETQVPTDVPTDKPETAGVCTFDVLKQRMSGPGAFPYGPFAPKPPKGKEGNGALLEYSLNPTYADVVDNSNGDKDFPYVAPGQEYLVWTPDCVIHVYPTLDKAKELFKNKGVMLLTKVSNEGNTLQGEVSLFEDRIYAEQMKKPGFEVAPGTETKIEYEVWPDTGNLDPTIPVNPIINDNLMYWNPDQSFPQTALAIVREDDGTIYYYSPLIDSNSTLQQVIGKGQEMHAGALFVYKSAEEAKLALQQYLASWQK